MAMTIEDKLGLNKFNVDSTPHIEIDENYSDQTLKERLVMACPAKLYKLREDNTVEFNYEGCLECGTCRVLTGGRIVKSWDHPIGGMGVAFKKG